METTLRSNPLESSTCQELTRYHFEPPTSEPLTNENEGYEGPSQPYDGGIHNKPCLNFSSRKPRAIVLIGESQTLRKEV